ncbi:MAG: hypothetical protein K0U93_15830, partial [Gammaproteobacteria bacterium]|nr:hypothetical protein [Gammaproteobacteria bacterium]
MTPNLHRRVLRANRRERGAALLVVLLFSLLLGASLLLSKLNAGSIGNPEGAARTTDALNVAREALLAWSVTHSPLDLPGTLVPSPQDVIGPGALPCPDTNNNGFPGPDCGDGVGRFPWRLLGTGDLRDGAGERLWYAVSPRYRMQTGIIASGGPTSFTDTATPPPFAGLTLADRDYLVYSYTTSGDLKNRQDEDAHDVVNITGSQIQTNALAGVAAFTSDEQYILVPVINTE